MNRHCNGGTTKRNAPKLSWDVPPRAAVAMLTQDKTIQTTRTSRWYEDSKTTKKNLKSLTSNERSQTWATAGMTFYHEHQWRDHFPGPITTQTQWWILTMLHSSSITMLKWIPLALTSTALLPLSISIGAGISGSPRSALLRQSSTANAGLLATLLAPNLPHDRRVGFRRSRDSRTLGFLNRKR
jgi:hypothetical protein